VNALSLISRLAPSVLRSESQNPVFVSNDSALELDVGVEIRVQDLQGTAVSESALQRYLAEKRPRPPRSLQQDYVQGHMADLRRGGVSHQPGTPVVQTGSPPSLLLQIWV